jgi:hypothetical protein
VALWLLLFGSAGSAPGSFSTGHESRSSRCR